MIFAREEGVMTNQQNDTNAEQSLQPIQEELPPPTQQQVPVELSAPPPPTQAPVVLSASQADAPQAPSPLPPSGPPVYPIAQGQSENLPHQPKKPIIKKWWFWVIIAAVVLAGAVGVIGFTLNAANQVPVPDVSEMTPSEAQASIRAVSDRWEIEFSTDSGTVATNLSEYSGYIVQSVNPQAGTVLDRTNSSVLISLVITKSAETLEAERIAAEEAAAEAQRLAEEAAAEEQRLAEERAALKAAAEPIEYTDLFRAGDNLFGTFFRFEGEIVQVVGDGTFRVNVTKKTYQYIDSVSYSDTVLLMILGDTGAKLLEKDIIQFIGMSAGTYEYESVMGATIEVPLLFADGVDVVLVGTNK
jgi:uncharacterized membrane protein